MAEDSPRKVTIGDNEFTVRRFKGIKASIAGALMSRVMREVPDLQDRAAAFRKEFREKNTLLITPAMAKLPRFEPLGLTAEDFRMGNGKVELPEEPTANAVLINIFPSIFELAEKELRRFFAILVIPNSEINEADEADEVEEVLTKWGNRLMREGDIDELLELVIVGLEVFKEQMASKGDRLGKLQMPWLNRILEEQNQETEEISEESFGPGESTPTPSETNPSPTENSQPSSSMPSQPDSVGTEEPLSTPSPGVS